jgi:Ca-activated chloride channel family protein
MSFGSPPVLLALLVVPALVAWYVGQQRGRLQAAEAFVAAPLAPSLMPNRPRWRRHLPLLIFLVALTVLVLAAARPRASVSVPVGRLSIMLATDVSGSMTATDIAPNRVTAAQRAADTFVSQIPSLVNVGVMEFNENPLLLQSPTRDHLALYAALGRLQTGGGTSIGNAVSEGVTVLSRDRPPASQRPTRAIVLLSDGYSTTGADPVAAARQAGRLHIPIFTVSLGTPGGTIAVPRAHGGGSVTKRVPPDPQKLGEIAQLSGGQAYAVRDANRLSQVYRQLGSRLAHVHEKREITVWFAGAAIAMLLLGGALSLRWFGKFI